MFCESRLSLFVNNDSWQWVSSYIYKFLRLANMSQLVTKPTKWHVRPAKTQISLGIRPVWSESSLCAHWVAKDSSFLHADSEDWPDWADAQADLSLRWEHMPLCWFYHEAAHMLASRHNSPMSLTGIMSTSCHIRQEWTLVGLRTRERKGSFTLPSGEIRIVFKHTITSLKTCEVVQIENSFRCSQMTVGGLFVWQAARYVKCSFTFKCVIVRTVERKVEKKKKEKKEICTSDL